MLWSVRLEYYVIILLSLTVLNGLRGTEMSRLHACKRKRSVLEGDVCVRPRGPVAAECNKASRVCECMPACVLVFESGRGD